MRTVASTSTSQRSAADNLESYTDGTTPIPANVTHYGGSAGAFAGGRPEVNVSHFGGSAGSFSGGVAAVNTIQWRGVQPSNLSSGRLDVTVGAMQATVIDAASIASDAITAAKVASDVGTEIATAVGALVCEANGSRTLKQIQSITLAVLAGVTANGGNTLKDPEGTAARVTATTDGSNNRTTMVLNPSA
jgi:hypothetical protein